MLSEENKTRLEANIWKFYVLSFVSSLWFSSAIFILYYQSFGLSFFQIGFIEMSIALFALLLEVPSGAFADLIGRKWSVLLGLAGLGAGMLAFGLAQGIASLLFASFVIAVGASFISGADMALIYDSLKGLGRESEFLRIRSRFVLVFYSAITIAAVVGGYLYSMNIRLPYYVSAATFAVSAVFMLSMQEPYKSKKRYNLARHIKQMKEGLNQLIKHEKLLWLTLISIVLGVFIGFFHNIIAQPYVRSLGFPAEQLGIIFGVIFMTTGFFMWKAAKIENWLGEKRSFYALVFGQAAVLMLMALISVKSAVIFILFIYIMWEFSDLIIQQYMHEHIKSSHRATVISIQRMIFGIAVIFIYLAFGKLSDIYSMATVFIVSAIAVLVLGLGLLHARYSRKIWRKLD